MSTESNPEYLQDNEKDINTIVKFVNELVYNMDTMNTKIQAHKDDIRALNQKMRGGRRTRGKKRTKSRKKRRKSRRKSKGR